jgi:hypothetical protein
MNVTTKNPPPAVNHTILEIQTELQQKPDYNHYGYIYDKNGLCINPIIGEHLRGNVRLIEITGVWHRQGKRIRFEAIDYLFPVGWDKMIINASSPLDTFVKMKQTYEKKSIVIDANLLEDQVQFGKMWLWWVPAKLPA